MAFNTPLCVHSVHKRMELLITLLLVVCMLGRFGFGSWDAMAGKASHPPSLLASLLGGCTLGRVFRKGRKAFDSLVTLAAWQCMFLKKMRVCFLSYLNETRAMHVFEKILISLQSIPGMDYFSLNCFPTVFRRSFLYIGLQRKLQYWSKVHGPNFLNHFCVK
jgi:hypothetical protein